MRNERDIVEALANSLVDKIAKKCIRGLQKLDITLSGDPRLKTTWDEICVQLQGEYSFYWDDYEDAVFNFAKAEVDKLELFEQMAIWFQTEESWEYDQEEDEKPNFNQDDVYRYIKSEIFKRGGNWSNKGIRNYLKD